MTNLFDRRQIKENYNCEKNTKNDDRRKYVFALQIFASSMLVIYIEQALILLPTYDVDIISFRLKYYNYIFLLVDVQFGMLTETAFQLCYLCNRTMLYTCVSTVFGNYIIKSQHKLK